MGDVSYAAQAGVAGVLFASGLLKLAYPRSLDEALEMLAVPAGARRPAAPALALVEIVLAVLLFLLRGNGVLAVAAAFIVLVSAALVALNRVAPHVSCGCLGELSAGDHSFSIVRNSLLLVLLGIAFVVEGTPNLLGAFVGIQIALLVILVPHGVWTLRELRLLRRAVAPR